MTFGPNADIQALMRLECLLCGYIAPNNPPPGTDYTEGDFNCPHCELTLAATYVNPSDRCNECVTKSSNALQEYSVETMVGNFSFDVSLAIRLAKDQTLMQIPRDILARYLLSNITEPKHYDHVDASIPGIIATITQPDQREGLLLIDGNHRGAKALRAGKSFYVYILPLALSQLCLLAYEKPI